MNSAATRCSAAAPPRRLAPRRRLATNKRDEPERDPHVEEAVRRAAAENVNPFAFSNLTLKSPVLWAAAALVCVVHFIAEDVREDSKQHAETDAERRRRVERSLAAYREKRADGKDG
mmetsp:Transcript_10050/g.31010  ORF Transcript_10050/g.31010 Transcript_10050/m.31010 type:complete len:117 (+) Transcript_10050:1-351(+)